MMKMTVKMISSEECKPLRHQVLWPHILETKDCIIDIDKRPDAIHLGAYDQEQLISICSLFEMRNDSLEYNSQYRLRAMATDPAMRGKSAGKAVVEYAIEHLRKQSIDILWCDAREVALGFYERLGFKTIGDFYEVRTIGPHKLMYFEL